MDKASPVVLGNRFALLAGAQVRATVLFASCLFGQLVFLLVSSLHELDDWAGHLTLNTQSALLARRGHLPMSPATFATMATRRSR